MGRPSLDELFVDVHDKKARSRMIHQTTRNHEDTLKELSQHLGLNYSTIRVIAGQVETVQKRRK